MTDRANTEVTPTEYLTMEVLAARHRVGEVFWTFPTWSRPTLRKLEAKGWVQWRDGVAEKTVIASLTDTGKDLWLYDDYLPPGKQA